MIKIIKSLLFIGLIYAIDARDKQGSTIPPAGTFGRINTNNSATKDSGSASNQEKSANTGGDAGSGGGGTNSKSSGGASGSISGDQIMSIFKKMSPTEQALFIESLLVATFAGYKGFGYLTNADKKALIKEMRSNGVDIDDEGKFTGINNESLFENYINNLKRGPNLPASVYDAITSMTSTSPSRIAQNFSKKQLKRNYRTEFKESLEKIFKDVKLQKHEVGSPIEQNVLSGEKRQEIKDCILTYKPLFPNSDEEIKSILNGFINKRKDAPHDKKQMKKEVEEILNDSKGLSDDTINNIKEMSDEKL